MSDSQQDNYEDLRKKYPPNNKPKIERIVQRPVIQRKKTRFQSLKEYFKEDGRTVTDYIIKDVVLPAVKDTISDAIQGGIEMLLYGSRKSTSRTNNHSPYISYNNYSQKRDIDINRTRTSNFRNIVIESRAEANDVMQRLSDLIIEYGQASTADLCDLIGITPEYTDNRYGWFDLRNANVVRVSGGYTLQLPRTVLLD